MEKGRVSLHFERTIQNLRSYTSNIETAFLRIDVGLGLLILYSCPACDHCGTIPCTPCSRSQLPNVFIFEDDDAELHAIYPCILFMNLTLRSGKT